MKKKLFMLEKVLFDLFSGLFLFAMFNRELNIFGLDLRIYVVALAVLLFITNLIVFNVDKKRLRFFNQPDRAVLWFLFFSILINFMWFFNGLQINHRPFWIVFASCCYNLGVYLFFCINKHLINWKKISVIISLSGLILVASIAASHIAGVDLRNYGSHYAGWYRDISHGFISRNRYGGYAQDPNYASLFMVIWAAVAIYAFVKTRKTRLAYFHLILLPLAIFGFLASSSKSILLILPVAVMILAVSRYAKIANFVKTSLLVGVIFVTLIITFDFVRPNVSLTMRDRFRLWRASSSAFSTSPFIGSGLTASRSAAVKQQRYVHPHSTVVQILIDMGITGLILLFLILKRNLNSENKLLVFLTIVFISHLATYETIYQAYFVFIVAILPIVFKKDNLSKKHTAAVFVVNSLSNGGAERVVQNMANQLCKQHKVVIYTLSQTSHSYQLDSRVEVVELSKNLSLVSAVLASLRLNIMLNKLSRTYEIVLATAHLPKAHLVARLSEYSQQFMYVNHGNYGVSNSLLNRLFMKFLYDRQKNITVSNGVMNDEIIKKFKIKTRSMKTIYNPINIKTIDEKIKLKFSKKPQILLVGRLSPPKQPYLSIAAFAKSGLAKTHKMVILGQGELLSKTKAEVKKYNLEQKVDFAGFVENPFSMMQESALLVLASEYESFGMVICEALMCGCPVVAFDTYGSREILTNELEKFIVPNGDVEMLAKKMQEAIKKYPSDLRSFIESRIEPYQIINQYLETYKQWNRY